MHYPNIISKLYSICIELPTVLKDQDKLIININNKTYEHIFDSFEVKVLTLDNPDSHLYVHDCKVTYDQENNYLFIEALFRNTTINYAILERQNSSVVSNGKLISQIPKRLQFELPINKLSIDDILIYINKYKKYEIVLTQDIIDQIISTGYTNPDGHLITFHTSNLGNFLWIQLSDINDTFTINGTYIIFDTLTRINSMQIEDIIPYKAEFNSIYGDNKVLSLGDIIEVETDKNTYTLNIDPSIFYNLGMYNYFDDPSNNYKVIIDKWHQNNICFWDISFNLTNPLEVIQSAKLIQNKASTYFMSNPPVIREITHTADPRYFTPMELATYSLAELEHRKQICICCLTGVIKQLKSLRDPTNPLPIAVKQQRADHIMDYTIYPANIDLQTKQYIYDTYGPFTSPRPDADNIKIEAIRIINSNMNLNFHQYNIPTNQILEIEYSGEIEKSDLYHKNVYLSESSVVVYSSINDKDENVDINTTQQFVFATPVKANKGNIILQELLPLDKYTTNIKSNDINIPLNKLFQIKFQDHIQPSEGNITFTEVIDNIIYAIPINIRDNDTYVPLNTFARFKFSEQINPNLGFIRLQEQPKQFNFITLTNIHNNEKNISLSTIFELQYEENIKPNIGYITLEVQEK